MAYIHFDRDYAPCAFLIVRDGADPYSPREHDTTLVQTDWDYPGVARDMGWAGGASATCDHGDTDGTVPCSCGKLPGEFISEAYQYIRDHEGEEYPELDAYLSA